jgi:uncharacterized repeat protein (TIGR03803 family)
MLYSAYLRGEAYNLCCSECPNPVCESSPMLHPTYSFLRNHFLGGFVTVLMLVAQTLAAGPHYRVLYTFQDSPDGSEPYAGLAMDAAGNLYGTTYHGGTEGTVFKLTRGTGGSWTESILFDFSDPSVSGGFPLGSVGFKDGDLYGTAGPGAGNQGVVFELTPSLSGFWNVLVPHTFEGQNDGGQPWAGVIFDQAGNLYGTTTTGSALPGNCGIVFQLVPSQGAWTENILHAFTCKKDGWFLTAPVVMDKADNLYGTTMWGGGGCAPYGCGTVFKLSQSSGVWSKQTLYYFRGGADGTDPYAALVLDKAGNLYGTTSLGGIGPCVISSTPGCGTVFELTPTARGEWKKTTIYSPDGSTGGGLFGGVVFDQSGNLYGTMAFYGKTGPGYVCAAGCGNVFKLTPGNGGTWTPTTVYQFGGDPDGGEPFGQLLIDKAGHIFGTTQYGGSSTGTCALLGCGVVFEIAP